ncbi:hypothetical protein [Alienimonas sp. DA493]|uniref:hypothetical protein n=1 Tax=Alienimonas sp. DA493 TaxID=3373605 RepID=UPI003754F21F
MLVAAGFAGAFCWPMLALGGLVWWFWRSDRRPDVPPVERGRVPGALVVLVLAAGALSLLGVGALFTKLGWI